MSFPKSARIVLATALLGLLAGYWLWVWQRGAVLTAPDAQARELPCVSYAPFRRSGHGPRAAAATREQVLEDLRQLRRIAPCVRTYGVDHGLEHVPGVAREVGLRVLLGAWLDRDPVASARQVDTALALVRSHRDVIDGLIVGNEVLLRGEMTPEVLAGWLAQARRRSEVPVSYADVWEFWLRHAAMLQPQVDVATVHILPYWEDHPVGAAQAADHVREVLQQVRGRLAGLPVFVGEVGWPADGRQRGPAVPSAAAQSAIARDLLGPDSRAAWAAPALRWPVFNWIEAFDQPWKRELEGAMGGQWGVFDAQGRQRLTLQGSTAAAPGHAQWPIAAASGALLACVLAVLARVPVVGSAGWMRASLWVSLPGLAVLGSALPLQWHWLVAWCRSPAEWLAWGAFSVLCSALAWQALFGRHRHGGLGWRALQAGVIAASLYWTLQLALDGRYRALWQPLPWACAWVLAWVAVMRGHGARAPDDPIANASVMSAMLAGLGLIAALWVLVHEGAANTEAVWLMAMHGLWLLGCRSGYHGAGADANADSSAGVRSFSRPSD